MVNTKFILNYYLFLKLILNGHNFFVERTSQENANSIKNDSESKVNLMKDSAMEAELRAARERAVVPLETRITQFREMLSEKEVN